MRKTVLYSILAFFLFVSGIGIYNSIVTISDTEMVVNGKFTSDYYYGQIYTDAGISKSTSPTDTYITLTGLTTDGSSNTTLTDSTITLDADGAGLYSFKIYANSVTHTANNTIVHVSLFIDDIEYTVCEGERKIGTGGDLGSFTCGALRMMSGGEVLKAKVKADNAGTFSSGHFNFEVVRLN